MTATIINAAPQSVMRGVQDKSTRAQIAEAEVLPQHLPKMYLFTEKGPVEPQLVSGASLTQMYGVNSFDLRKKYATHATAMANTINAAGNAMMVERMKPVDAAPPATLRLSLDVLPATLPVYERNSDGSFKKNSAGQNIDTGATVPGFKAKWVVTEVTVALGESTFGSATQGPGDQTDGATQSLRYPIGDWQVSSFGEHGNNLGLRMWAPTTKSSQPLDDRLITQAKVYPFRMACMSRASATASASVVETLFAEQFINVCFKPNTIDKNTDTLVYAGDVFINAYQELTTPGMPPHYGPFGAMHLYNDNIQELLTQFYEAEYAQASTGHTDFTGEADEEYRFNMISGVTSEAVPYTTFQVVTGANNSVRLTESSTMFAVGGSDGTMTEAIFGELVAEAVSEYADENSRLQDTAKYPESIIYDSGYPLATKYALASFIAVRKDTALVLATHDVLSPVLSASEESALAIALRTRLQMFPESDYFGTPTMRAMIVGRCGKMLNSQYTKKLPLTFEIAKKAATYMGAGNGKWKANFNFDSAPQNQVTMFSDVNVTFTPAPVRNKDWTNGLNWVESFDRQSLYFPALKTVYDNDTSVLTSFFTMMACVELEKVGERARRQFSGQSSLTNGQLIERLNKFVIENTNGRFDGRFIIKSNAYFTKADTARGFSWTLPISIYAPNMTTVGTISIEAYRISDLDAQA